VFSVFCYLPQRGRQKATLEHSRAVVPSAAIELVRWLYSATASLCWRSQGSIGRWGPARSCPTHSVASQSVPEAAYTDTYAHVHTPVYDHLPVSSGGWTGGETDCAEFLTATWVRVLRIARLPEAWMFEIIPNP
jgi:hypothetical protein